MPAHNAQATIGGSIESVLGQTFRDFELIVIDDCSSDRTAEIVSAMARRDGRITLLKQTENLRVAKARNAGIQAAGGRCICFLDSDDQWLPEKLQRQHQKFQEGATVVFSSYWRAFPDGYASIVTAGKGCTANSFLFSNPIGNLTGAYDCQALGKFFQLPVGHEDYLMWREVVAKSGGAVGIAEPLAIYRVSGGSLSGDKKKAAKWHWNILRTHFGLSLPAAVPAFLVYAVMAVGQRLNDRISRRKSHINLDSTRQTS